MAQVILLDKHSSTWKMEEIAALVTKARVGVVRLPARPSRIVALARPPAGTTFADAIGHAGFNETIVNDVTWWSRCC